MKNVLPALFKVSVFAGFLWFSLYAFNVNENKKSSELQANIQENVEKAETLERVNKSKVAKLQSKINTANRESHERYKTLLIMFPDDESHKMIEALFESDSDEDDEDSDEQSDSEETPTEGEAE